MALFSKKHPAEKRYNKATKRLRNHIIDESINPIPGSDIMDAYVKDAATEAAAAWHDLNPGAAPVSDRDAEAVAHADVFVAPVALKGNNFGYALDVMEGCQLALMTALQERN